MVLTLLEMGFHIIQNPLVGKLVLQIREELVSMKYDTEQEYTTKCLTIDIVLSSLHDILHEKFLEMEWCGEANNFL